MDEGVVKLIGVASITGLAFIAILWMRLRWLMYRDVEPEISTKAQIIAHSLQATTLLSIAFLFGEPPMIDIPVLRAIVPIFWFGYLVTFFVAYILKTQQYRRIVKSREELYKRLEGENLD